MSIQRKILLFLISTLFLTIAFCFSPKDIRAQVLFSDDFEIGSASWTPTSGSWSVQVVDTSNRYGTTVNSSGSCCSESVAGVGTWSDYAYEFDLLGKQGEDKNAIFRYQSPSIKYGIHLTNTRISLEKHIPGSSIDIAWFPGNFSNNVVYHIKIEAIGNHIRIYVNNVLYIDHIDSTSPILNGKIGFRVGTGAVAPSQIWYDNVVVTQIDEFSIPPPTPVPTIGPFELPIEYPGRLASDPTQFKSAFWQNLNATFDHLLKTGQFIPFTGNSYSPTSCPSGTLGITCYDSHNGIDFSRNNSTDVLSVAEGVVYYTSPHTFSSCTPEKGGFGCVVIVGYPGNIFGLYSHLSKINVLEGQPVTNNTVLGIMGETGCPGCGIHLHFGILKPVGAFSLANPFMTKKDWQGLMANIKAPTSKGYKPSCTYMAPNRIQFSFQDPTGWKGSGTDPWSLPKSQGGCGITSPYLWKYEVGSNP